MVDITIQDLELITSPSLLNGAIFHFQDATDAYTDKVATLPAMAECILREKSIPPVGSAIVTDSATQTLTNKKLTSPKINSDTTITANGADINKLHGVTASTTEINYLTGVTSSIQAQINQIISQSQGVTSRIYHYSPGVVSGVTQQIINEATLREENGIPSWYRVDPNSISVSVYKLESSRWYLLSPAPEGEEGMLFFTTTIVGPASQIVLNSIDITLLAIESYRIVVNYKVLVLSGV